MPADADVQFQLSDGYYRPKAADQGHGPKLSFDTHTRSFLLLRTKKIYRWILSLEIGNYLLACLSIVNFSVFYH